MTSLGTLIASRATRAIALAALLLCGVGCSTKSNLRIAPLKGSTTFSQSFSGAFAQRSVEGGYDVVLTSDANPSSPDGRTTGSAQRLQQVMHVRVLWQPMAGTKRDTPTATNATVSWYVLGDDGRSKEMIEYTGAAFVTVSRKGNQTRLDISNASLKPTARQGNLTDPIGPSKLTGTVFARNNGKRVADVLATLKTTVAQVTAPARLAAERQASSSVTIEP